MPGCPVSGSKIECFRKARRARLDSSLTSKYGRTYFLRADLATNNCWQGHSYRLLNIMLLIYFCAKVNISSFSELAWESVSRGYQWSRWSRGISDFFSDCLRIEGVWICGSLNPSTPYLALLPRLGTLLPFSLQVWLKADSFSFLTWIGLHGAVSRGNYRWPCWIKWATTHYWCL